jgi:phosphoribosylanthranilate isomerase
MTVIKICGITNLEDALHAAKVGADALGFNFYDKSPRYIAPGAVRDILRKVRMLRPEIAAVGVFVNEEAARAYDIAIKSDIDVFQFHGDESSDYVSTLRSWLGLTVIKAFRVNDQFDTSILENYQVDAVLLDGFSQSDFGGTGTRTDWNVAAKVAEAGNQLYLAGGLSVENVNEAVRAVRPFAVDACSLLESSKGKKDPEKVRQFVENVKKYE